MPDRLVPGFGFDIRISAFGFWISHDRFEPFLASGILLGVNAGSG